MSFSWRRLFMVNHAWCFWIQRLTDACLFVSRAELQPQNLPKQLRQTEKHFLFQTWHSIETDLFLEVTNPLFLTSAHHKKAQVVNMIPLNKTLVQPDGPSQDLGAGGDGNCIKMHERLLNRITTTGKAELHHLLSIFFFFPSFLCTLLGCRQSNLLHL